MTNNSEILKGVKKRKIKYVWTCCNFFTRDTINGDPKYCGSHLDKHGNMQKQFKNMR